METKQYRPAELKTLTGQDENNFFSQLHERFLRLARYRIREANDAEEVAQEAIVAIIDQYRNPKFEGKFLNWAFTVLRNKIVDYQRKKIKLNQREITSDKDLDKPSPAAHDPEALLAGVELREKLKKAMYSLNDKERALLEALLSGENCSQMASRLKFSKNTVYVRINRLRSKLQKLIFHSGKGL